MNILNRIKNYKNLDLLIISNKYSLRNVGAEQPIHRYYEYYKKKYGLDKVKIIYALDEGAWYSLLMSLIFSKNILVNGLGVLLINKVIFFLFFKKSSIYLHETKYAFDDSLKKNSVKTMLINFLFKKFTKILCVSMQQKEYIKKKFKINDERLYIVYNAIKNLKNNNENPYSIKCINIVMVGTIQSRKGVDLFSSVADYYSEAGKSFKFHWVGHKVRQEKLYLSDNVTWHGRQINPAAYIEYADILFLSSIDDPFPLSVLEAIQLKTKVIVYKNIGSSEILKNINGCAIFENYNVNSVVESIKLVLQEELDLIKLKDITTNISSVESFFKRINEVFNIYYICKGGSKLQEENFNKIKKELIECKEKVSRQHKYIVALTEKIPHEKNID